MIFDVNQIKTIKYNQYNDNMIKHQYGNEYYSWIIKYLKRLLLLLLSGVSEFWEFTVF